MYPRNVINFLTNNIFMINVPKPSRLQPEQLDLVELQGIGEEFNSAALMFSLSIMITLILIIF